MSEANFDEIATAYDESMPAHVIDHYLDKRLGKAKKRKDTAA